MRWVAMGCWYFGQRLGGDASHLDGLVQDFSNSSALAMESLQSCTKPSYLHLEQLSFNSGWHIQRHFLRREFLYFDSNFPAVYPEDSLNNTSSLVQVMAWHQASAEPFPESNQTLTLSMLEPCYLGLTRSISWLLMPWLLTSLGHQQPWYWLCRICRSWSYLRKDFVYLCHINVE